MSNTFKFQRNLVVSFTIPNILNTFIKTSKDKIDKLNTRMLYIELIAKIAKPLMSVKLRED